MNKTPLLLTLICATLLTTCFDHTESEITNRPLSMTLIGRYNDNALFNQGMSEIVAYHTASHSALVINASASTVDILDISNLTDEPLQNPLTNGNVSRQSQIHVQTILPDAGGINSVAVYGNLIAIAVEHKQKQKSGFIAFYSINAQAQTTYIKTVDAGALPDNVVFTKDGHYVLSANEGEPSNDYSIDPEGSVTLVSIINGLPDTVQQINFRAFNQSGNLHHLLDNDVRISGPDATVAQDLEPEYIAISDDSKVAYVSLQENNAYAIIDINSATVTAIKSFGFKDHGADINALDASDKDNAINIKPYPQVFGLYMPDTVQSYSVNGTNYLITANEGDSREYAYQSTQEQCLARKHLYDEGKCFSWVDETRVKNLSLDPVVFTDPSVQDDENLGRLKTLTTMGDSNHDGFNERIYSFGGRSFSVLNADTGQQLYDSGKDFETITAEILKEAGFNSNNDKNDFDNRSDDKGPEPEALAIGSVNNQTYAFIGLERTGGIMVYNITNPADIQIEFYHYNRDLSVDIKDNPAAAGDLAAEGMAFVPAVNSPTGHALLIVGNEVSGTTTFYQLK